ncbi:MAG TPA: PQQ-binding-like beta-propeller repeat protein [Gemmataceae bacterium]|nr:PQQ-binding-like beta-propeller repeat protein [Gemmataceae bacterium]
MTLRTLCFTLVATVPIAAAEPDWPQFRGPRRDGISPDKGLLKEWPKGGPPVAWKAEGVGEGYSSVAVVGDKVLTMGDLDGASHVVAVSRTDGKKLWATKVGKAGDGGGYKGSRSTPTVDGDQVFALGPHGDLICVALADGKEQWKVSLPKDFKGSGGGWQYSESVLVDGNKVICTPGGKEATMLALNKKTGEVVWKGQSPDHESAGYSSIMISNAGGTKQYVTLTSHAVVSFAADTGNFLWQYGDVGPKERERNRFRENTANIPTVVLTDDPNQIFATAGYDRGAALIKLDSEGGKITADEVYWTGDLKNKHGGVIRVGEFLYGDLDDSGEIWCAELKSGKKLWHREDKLGHCGSASLCYADGMLYVRFQNGMVGLIEANPKKYTLVSSFKIPDPIGNAWAHPVVIGGKFYVREKEVIWCYDVAAK